MGVGLIGTMVRRIRAWKIAVGLMTLTTAVTVWPAPAQAVTTNGLWHMDDAGSTMVDSSGHGLNGTVSHVQTGQPGVLGYAYRFVAPRSRVEVASSPLLDPGTAVFSVAMRLRFSSRPTAAVGDYDLARKGLSTTLGGSWKVEILSTGRAFCQFIGASARAGISRGPDLADGRWHTVRCRRGLLEVTLTVDGHSWSVSRSTGAIRNGSGLVIGAKNSDGEDQYQGLMDELVVTVG